jgi:bleomycin hydrolase
MIDPAATTSDEITPLMRGDDAGALTDARLAALNAAFDATPAYRLAQNAVSQVPIQDVALDRRIVTDIDHTFSHRLDDWEVTNQKKTGRCWMFAGLNLLRPAAMKRMNLKDFQFSQNHTLFWDKFERANYFLEAIIETADRPLDDRTVAFLLSRPLDDGGQWNMFVNIIQRHGLVPQPMMPETESSSCTGPMNARLLAKLRETARTLRGLVADGATPDAVRAAKDEALTVIHRMLSIHLGTPPTSVQWQWRDDAGNFHREDRLTPQEFAARCTPVPLEEYVCLVHDPRASSPVGRTFTVKYLGNVVGGKMVRYLNVPIDVMKQAAMETIVAGEPVWMGCDVGKMMHRDRGIWDARLYDHDLVYDTSFTLDKAARLEHHDTQMTHAMLFTGVDVVDGAPRRWRVENSWGDTSGHKGYYTMNDSWFDEHMFEIAAHVSRLPEQYRAALEQEPIVLAPWDPMGALARG